MGNSKGTKSKITQEMVNLSEFLLYLDSCIQYGLLEMRDEKGQPIKGPSGIHVDKILHYLERAKKKGVLPQKEVVESAEYIQKAFAAFNNR